MVHPQNIIWTVTPFWETLKERLPIVAIIPGAALGDLSITSNRPLGPGDAELNARSIALHPLFVRVCEEIVDRKIDVGEDLSALISHLLLARERR